MNDTPSAVELDITTLTPEGAGVGRLDGRVYFVPGAFPGDTVLARAKKESMFRYLDARLEALVRSSPSRVEMDCPHGSSCGGCPWIGSERTSQAKWKRHALQHAVGRALGRQDVPIELHPAPLERGNRNRIHIRCAFGSTPRVTLGYHKRQSLELVPIENCLAADEAIQSCLVRIAAASLPVPERVRECRLEIQAYPLMGADAVSIVVYSHPAQRERIGEFCAALSALPGVLWAGPAFCAPDDLWFPFWRRGNVEFCTKPGLYQQVSGIQNQRILDLVESEVENHAPEEVVDLFCGSGNLSIAVAGRVKRVRGCEENPRAIAAARYNAAHNGFSNCEYAVSDSAAWLQPMLERGEKIDLALVDPAKDGCGLAAKLIGRLAPKRLLLMSCSQIAFAADSAALEKRGLRLERVVAVEYFPHTPHLNVVGLFQNLRVP